jgi:hypothetical protein
MIGGGSDKVHAIGNLAELSDDQTLGTEGVEIGCQMRGPVTGRLMRARIGIRAHLQTRVIDNGL